MGDTDEHTARHDDAAEVRAEERERIARALLAVDPAEWALAGQHAGEDAARIARDGGPAQAAVPVSHDVPDWVACEMHARDDTDRCVLHSAHRWRGAVPEGRVDPPHRMPPTGGLCWSVTCGHERATVAAAEAALPAHRRTSGIVCRIGGDGRCRIPEHYQLRA
ncbi:MAG: hypothetical protein ACRDQD_12425 [Nocardioidaceae bacterium]